MTSYKSFNSQRIFWSLCFSFFCIQLTVAQEISKKNKHHVFIEGFGAGAYYSLNYAHRVWKNKDLQLFPRIGLSTYHLRDFKNKINPDLIIPLGMELYYGRQHLLLAGFGNVFTSIIKADSQNFKPKRDWENHGYLLLGYTFQKKGSLFSFGVAYTPLLERYQTFRHWATIRIGRFL